MKKIFGLTFLVVMLVGCKPLTGDNVCVHTNIKDAEIGTVLENGEVVSAVKSAWYGYNESSELDLVWTEVATHYVCTDCGKVFKKNVAFFTTDDHKTTIGKATDVTLTRYKQLPINEELTMFYNRYYDEVVKNNSNDDWTYYCSCSCGGDCGCQEYCTCGPNNSDDPDNCVRSYHNIVYFGGYYITVPNN